MQYLKILKPNFFEKHFVFEAFFPPSHESLSSISEFVRLHSMLLYQCPEISWVVYKLAGQVFP